jgi:hypothetical protein
LTRKSATRICSRLRATSASKLCVTTTTGGERRLRSIMRSSAAISSGRPASRSTMTTVTPSVSKSTLATVPDTTRSSIAPLAPNVDAPTARTPGRR